MKFENYNIISENDILKTELSSIESFEAINPNSIPIVPNLKYTNFINFKDYSIINDLDFTILKRDESTIESPSESFKIKLLGFECERRPRRPSRFKFAQVREIWPF